MKNNDIFWLVGGLVAAAVIAKQFAIAGTAPATTTVLDTGGTAASTGTSSTDVEAAIKALKDQNTSLQNDLAATQKYASEQLDAATKLASELDLVRNGIIP